MTTKTSRNTCQPVPSQCSSAAATRTMAAVSLQTRASSSTARYRAGSASTAWSRVAARFRLPLRLRASSPAPDRDTRMSATSALAHSPAPSVRAAAAMISHAMVASPRPFLPLLVAGPPGWLIPGRAPGREQLVLQAEHRGVLVRLSVVIPEQVQDAVRAEQFELVTQRMLRLAGLVGGDVGTEHDVAEQAGRRRRFPARALVDPGTAAGGRRSQLIHGEGQHVGRARFAH